ncbi:MAG: cytochrome c [Proteobacteria bacterium]|nr:cytochrome c [Pseudomonadota bacterium]
MLSKSQAKWFFLVATGGFSAVFLFLTVDTIRQLPERTHENDLSESALRGRLIWDENNCMGCHTLLGEGAYYAPELTLAVERRGKPWLRTFLKDPQAMYPGRRKMVQYNFTEEEIEDVIDFLDWVGKIDTNGFPAKPRLQGLGASEALPTEAGVAALAAAPPVYGTICAACHAVGGSGGNVGPALDGVGTRITSADLDIWLKDPQSVKPGTTMPNLNLTDADRAALVTWLSSLK